MLPQAFGEGDPWTIGVEEELYVVDPASVSLAPVPSGLVDGTRLKIELFAAVVEVNTPVCASAAEVAEALASIRARAKDGVAEAGLAVAGAGVWPTAVPEGEAITQDEGYLQFVEYAGPSARRQVCSGLHVHVAVESPEACMTALEWVLPWLPVLLAISANAPYLDGRETGLASTRAELLALLPRSAGPPRFDSYAEWERFAERLVELGLADRWTRIWWDVRPHPAFGTLEVRAPDQPTRVDVSVAFAALVQALVASAEPGPPADRGLYAQNRWAALRFGPQAELVHPDGSRLSTARDLMAELLERVGPEAERLGGAPFLAPLERLDQAAEQLAVGRRDGVRAVCEHLIADT